MSADAAPISAADAALVERYLEHVRVEKRLAERTLALYSLDLEKLAQFAAQSGVALTTVGNHHVRRWVAQMHAGGRSGRGIALILSGWRGFYAWLGREGLISMFSLPWRIISIRRSSSTLIFSRSISAWRSCRLTARPPCGLVSCTAPSRSAWRSKKSGVWIKNWAMSSSVIGWVCMGVRGASGRF